MLWLRWYRWLCCPFSHPGPFLLPFDAWPKHKVLTYFFLGPLFVDPGGVLLIDGWSIEPSESCSSAAPLPVPFGTQLSLQRTAPSFAGAKLAPDEQLWHAMEGKSLCLSLASRSVPAVGICGVGGWVRFTCLKVKPGLYFPSALDRPCSERSPKDGPLRSNWAALYLQVMLVPITGAWAGADPHNSLHCWDAPCLAGNI